MSQIQLRGGGDTKINHHSIFIHIYLQNGLSILTDQIDNHSLTIINFKTTIKFRTHWKGKERKTVEMRKITWTKFICISGKTTMNTTMTCSSYRTWLKANQRKLVQLTRVQLRKPKLKETIALFSILFICLIHRY